MTNIRGTLQNSVATVAAVPGKPTLNCESIAEAFLTDIDLAARFRVHRSTPWRWVKTDPTFPKPVILSPGCTRWKSSEVLAWEASKARAS